jgi:hypothetical protein
MDPVHFLLHRQRLGIAEAKVIYPNKTVNIRVLVVSLGGLLVRGERLSRMGGSQGVPVMAPVHRVAWAAIRYTHHACRFGP